jgi:FtsH-binding integral membrane protein
VRCIEQPIKSAADKKSILGALTVYLDFPNLFLMLLRLMDDRRQ